MSNTVIKPFGSTQVYAPRGDPTVDIVFVHGLNGHPMNSWSSKSGCFWPVDLLPEVLAPLRPRILTYGYNANVAAFTDGGASRDTIVGHAETLASNLAANRNLRNCPERPIIFVCHSLGGLVVKRALIYSRSVADEKTEHLRSVYVSTFGILFLGTPHNGSNVAKWGLLLHNICSAVLPKKVMEGSPQLIQALRKDNEMLQHINSLFANIMSRFHIYLFHETQSMDVKGTRQIIVDEASAAPYFEGVERMGIEADHSHMCKFEDENAPGYEAVAEAILRYSRQAPTVIADRWIEEKKTRVMEKKAKAREIYDPAGQSMPDLKTTGSVMTLPKPPATDGGRNSPVSDPGNSLMSSQISYKGIPLFVAPPGFHPNATFFGMQKELDILHNRLFKAKARADRTVAVLIAGVPGSGKTHLARQYVFTRREFYPGGIFWVDAKSRESSYKCFWEIAQAATLIDRKEAQDPEYQQSESYVNAVRHWLQTRQEWLLVFDGITFDHDDDINQFRDFLPWNQRCSIIYTSIDTTLRKKSRLYEPYCLSVSRLSIEDACKLLFKDLGIKKPTSEQVSRAVALVDHYERLPLAIHAVGHRLNATGKPIERFKFKSSQMTDRKLAEPFLCIMNDLLRLNQRPALNLINLLAFLGHNVPVGLISLGRAEMTVNGAEILSSAQDGEDPDLDTTLGTLIHYGLIERTTDAVSMSFSSTSAQQSGDDATFDATPTPGLPGLTESITEGSQDGFFSLHNNSVADVVKMHSVVQRFCRDELRVQDAATKAPENPQNPGHFDSWLIVATRFLCKSYEAAKEKMDHYHDCGLVRDYREYETHASGLVELFPKRLAMSNHPLVLHEAREHLRQLMRSLSNEIERVSPSSSQQVSRNQKSVFDRSSSSSSSFPESSSADEGLSRESTWGTGSGSIRTESPEQIVALPRFKLDLFPPRMFREAAYESEDGYETDGEAKQAPRISPALSQMSQTTEKPQTSPPLVLPPAPPTGLSPSSATAPSDDQSWQLVDRYHKSRLHKNKRANKRTRGPRRIRGTKSDTPVATVSSVHGTGSSSRSTDESSSALAEAKRTLVAIGRSNSGQTAVTEAPKENVPTYASVAARYVGETDARRASIPAFPGSRSDYALSGLQRRSLESLDTQPTLVVARELLSEPLSRSTYSEPGQRDSNRPRSVFNAYPAAGESHVQSRRSSLVYVFEPGQDMSASVPSLPYQEAPRHMSASTPSLLPDPAPLPYDENISITAPPRRVSQWATGSNTPSTSKPAVAHPSAIMPGAHPLQLTISQPSGGSGRPWSEPMSHASSAASHQSWVTEPGHRYSPRFSPVPGFQQSNPPSSNDTTRTATPRPPQQQWKL